MTTARNRRKHSLARLFVLGVSALTAALAARPATAGYREKVLFHFCHISNGIPLCGRTGGEPTAGLTADGAGNLYGTTTYGGAHKGGTVFELTPNASGTGWTETTLYNFCGQTNCTDGWDPYAGLIMDSAGDLYGTTLNGGAYDYGTVFELTPNAAKAGWTETVLFSFCSQTHCPNADRPVAGLIMDDHGNLYGTTASNGTVFELTPNPTRTAWTKTVLYHFCRLKGCVDGEGPLAGLIMDGSGYLYGTTSYGGAHDGGTVFNLAPNADKAEWTETVLYSFCSKTRCSDGSNPAAGLIMDAAGNLYGTTQYNAPRRNGRGFGVVFELAPNASRSAWRETVLHRFCRRAGCIDGANPVAGLIMDTAGNLYGTTTAGGISNAGVAFALAPDSAQASVWRETVLHQFCPQEQAGCPDGAGPEDGLIMDTVGDLYGTTLLGGAGGGGVVFQLEPAP